MLFETTYNTNDSSIVISVVSLDGLDERHRGEEKRDPREESKAKGQRTARASHCGRPASL